MKKGDILYYARILPDISYDVYELKVRMITDTWFSATEKITKMAFLFDFGSIGKEVFVDRNDALLKVREAEKSRTKFCTERYYEEY